MKVFFIFLGMMVSLNSFSCSWDVKGVENELVNKVMKRYRLSSQEIVKFEWLERGYEYTSPNQNSSCSDYLISYMDVTYLKNDQICVATVKTKLPLNPMRLRDYFGYKKIIAHKCN